MSNAKRNYARYVRKFYDKSSRPLWPIHQEPVKVGAYGDVIDGVFLPLGNIADDFGVTVEELKDNTPATMSLTASKETSISIKLSGETNADLPSVPKAKAGMSIKFSNEGAFVFAAEKVYAPRIKNFGAVSKAIKALREENKWDMSWRVVTSLVQTPSCKIFVSLSKESQIELSFEGILTPSISELGKASSKVTIKNKVNNVFDLNPAENITPFLQLRRLKRKFLSSIIDFRPLVAISDDISYEFEFDQDEELSFDELEDLRRI